MSSSSSRQCSSCQAPLTPEAGRCPRCQAPVPTDPLPQERDIPTSGSPTSPRPPPQRLHSTMTPSHGVVADIPPGLSERYKVIRPLGGGGMGLVFLMRDVRLERDVALKVIRGMNEQMRRRFEQEARLLAGLEGENLVRVYDFGVVQDVPYIVMEYVRGKPLNARLAAGRPTQVETARIVLDILKGITIAHERGIVHRDLKPANIFLDESGRAKVADFGLARRDAQAAVPSPVSATPSHPRPGIAPSGDAAAGRSDEAQIPTSAPAGDRGGALPPVGGASAAPAGASVPVRPPGTSASARARPARTPARSRPGGQATGKPGAGEPGFGTEGAEDAPGLDATPLGAILGTPGYMAPEQAAGTAVGPAADIYAVGVILHEMLTGQRLFAGQSIGEILRRQSQAPPAPPSRVNPSIAPALDALAMRALAASPLQRPTAGELARSLEAWLETSGKAAHRRAGGDLPAHPYKRLEHYGEADAPIFFGRDAEIIELVEVIESPAARVVFVFGPCGIGKSSLIHAGLIPALDPARHEPLALISGAHPARALREALAARMQRAGLTQEGGRPVAARDLELAPSRIPDWMAALERATTRRMVIVVDQLEEMFTSSDGDTAAAEDFFALAALLVESPAVNATLVLSYRTEFRGEMLPLEVRLARYQASIAVREMDEERLEEALVGVSRIESYGFRYAPGLGRRIAREVLATCRARGETALPAIQIIGAQLYDAIQRSGRDLIDADLYEKSLGGAQGVLRRHVESELARPEYALGGSVARQILRALTQKAEGGERHARALDEDEVLAFPDRAQARRTLELLLAAHLVIREATESGARRVRLASEVIAGLVDAWSIEPDDAQRAAVALERAFRQWEDQGRREDDLLSGRTLALVRGQRPALQGVSDGEDQFLHASVARTRRRGLTAASIVTAVVVAIGVLGYDAFLRPGRLSLTSDPDGAEVLEGMASLGRTPLDWSARPGAHVLRIRKDRFQDMALAVDIPAGGATARRADLLPAFQHLAVRSDPLHAQCELRLLPAGDTGGGAMVGGARSGADAQRGDAASGARDASGPGNLAVPGEAGASGGAAAAGTSGSAAASGAGTSGNAAAGGGRESSGPVVSRLVAPFETDVAPGRYALSVGASGYLTASRTLDLSHPDRKPVVLDVTLESNTGQVIVRGRAQGALLVLRDAKTGQEAVKARLPLERPQSVPAGTYMAECTKEGAARDRFPISVARTKLVSYFASTPELETVWSAPLEGLDQPPILIGMTSMPALLVTTAQGDGLVLDAATGARRGARPMGRQRGWTRPLARGGDPAGAILSLDDTATLSAFESAGGKLLWSARTRITTDAMEPHFAAGPLLARDRAGVAIVNGDGTIQALDGADGRTVWTAGLGGPCDQPPALADLDGDGVADVIAAREDGTLVVLAGKTGQVLWRAATARGPGIPCVGDVDGDGTPDVIVATMGGMVHAVSGRTGKLIWRVRPRVERDRDAGPASAASPESLSAPDARGSPRSPRVPASPGAGSASGDRASDASDASDAGSAANAVPEGMDLMPLAVGDLDGDGHADVIVTWTVGPVVALSGIDGKTLWSFSPDAEGRRTPVLADLDGDGHPDVLIGTAPQARLSPPGALYALDGPTGALLFDLPVPSGVAASPVVADLLADGQREVLVSSYDGTLRAVRASVRPVAWVTPIVPTIDWTRTGDLDGDGVPDVMAGVIDTGIMAYSGRTGEPLWTQPLPESPDGIPVIAPLRGGRAMDFARPGPGGSVEVREGRTSRLLWSIPATTPSALPNPSGLSLPASGRSPAPQASPSPAASPPPSAPPPTGWATVPGADEGAPSVQLAAADLDRDGVADLIMTRPRGRVIAASGARQGRGMPLWEVTLPGDVHSLTVVPDLDGNGVPDIAVTLAPAAALAPAGSGLLILSGATGRTLYHIVSPPGLGEPLLAADLAGTGKRDLVAGSQDGHVVAVDPRTGAVLWDTDVTLEMRGDSLSALRCGDLTGQGHSSVVAALGNKAQAANAGRVVALDGRTGKILWAVATAGNAQSLALADVTGGGRLDVCVRSMSRAHAPGDVRILDGATGRTRVMLEAGYSGVGAAVFDLPPGGGAPRRLGILLDRGELESTCLEMDAFAWPLPPMTPAHP